MSKPINDGTPYIIELDKRGIECPRCHLILKFNVRYMMYVNKSYSFKCPCCGKNLKVKMF